MTRPDPEFVALHKAVYGESVDVDEAWDIAKFATDAPDVHSDTQTKRQRKLAATGLAATGVASLGGVHAIKATLGEAKKAKKLAAERGVVRSGPRLLRKVPHISPVRAAQLGTAGWLGLHGVELVGDALALHAQGTQVRKPVVDTPAKHPVGKALRIRLRPVNAGEVNARPPSLLARRPRSSPGPRVVKSFDADVEITKLDTDKHQVFGWAQVAKWDGEEVHDRQGDVVSIEELEKAAYDYVLDARVGGDQHGRVAKADTGPRQTATLIESMVFTPEKIEKMGLPADFPQAWWTGFFVHDPNVWEDIKLGKRQGLSVHGSGRRELIEKGEKLRQLKRRTEAAVHPPPVARHPVDSSAVKSMGYQPQTHRLAYEMHSRPDQPYNYRASRAQAQAAQHTSSIGHQYATVVRGKYKRKEKVNPVDRARLFVNPPDREVGKREVVIDGKPVSTGSSYDPQDLRRVVGSMRGTGRRRRLLARKYANAKQHDLAERARKFRAQPATDPHLLGKSVDPQVQHRRKVASTTETAASLTAGTLGAGFAAAEARKKFKEEHPQRYARMASGATRWGAKGPVRAVLAHDLVHGKPGLVSFGTAIGAGAIAGTAHRYQQASALREQYEGSELQHRVRRAPRKLRRVPPAQQPVAKVDSGVLTPEQMRRRQRRAAFYAKTGAVLGLGALGSKVGAAGVRRFVQPAERGAEIADKLERHTSTVLAGGAGLGAVSGFNSAKMARSASNEAQQRKAGTR